MKFAVRWQVHAGVFRNDEIAQSASASGIKTLIKAFPKKPSTADNLSELFRAPTESASLRPATISSFVRPLPFFLPKMPPAFFRMSVPVDDFFCAQELSVIKINRGKMSVFMRNI